MAGRLFSFQKLRRAPFSLLLRSVPATTRHSPSFDSFGKIQNQRLGYELELFNSRVRYGYMWCYGFHTSQHLSNINDDVVKTQRSSGDQISVDDNGQPKMIRKKLKGKRAVVRWLKFFRWKKKKAYERMTAEEKILYKLKKARRKENQIVEALKKIEPADSSETTHDPEILTPEEHFYFLKIGHKSKNYVPVGRRGIFQGVILNMHLHWKKHQTLKVVVKTFTADEVREIAAELARLSGGIVLDIVEDNTIIMYRGRNYSQPPTEIMSPKVTLTRKKALDKSKHRDALRAVRKFIPKLEQDLENLCTQMTASTEAELCPVTNEETTEAVFDRLIAETQSEGVELGETKVGGNELHESNEDSTMVPRSWSDSEDLSDIFSTDSDMDSEEKRMDKPPLFLDQFAKFPSENDAGSENFEDHLRQIAASKKNNNSSGKDVQFAELDEIDKIFLRAGSLLKRKK
ncbi:putative CRM domain-containing protein [Dioscorea sansibarensis]